MATRDGLSEASRPADVCCTKSVSQLDRQICQARNITSGSPNVEDLTQGTPHLVSLPISVLPEIQTHVHLLRSKALDQISS